MDDRLSKKEAEALVKAINKDNEQVRDSLWRAYKTKAWESLEDPAIKNFTHFVEKKTNLQRSWAWAHIQAGKVIEEMQETLPAGLDLSVIRTNTINEAIRLGGSEVVLAKVSALVSPTVEDVESALRQIREEFRPKPLTPDEVKKTIEFAAEELPPCFQGAFDSATIALESITTISKWPDSVSDGLADLVRGHDVLVDIAVTLDSALDRLYEVLEGIEQHTNFDSPKGS